MAKCDAGFTGPTAALTLRLKGPTINVNIGIVDPAKPTVPPAPAVTDIPALVDTGAGGSFIDDNLAAALKLPIVDRATVSGSAGSHPTNVYLAYVDIPSLGMRRLGKFSGVKLLAGGQEHAVLLGRDLLQSLTMTYEGKTGKVTLSS